MKQTLVKLVDAILKQMEDHPETAGTEKGIRAWLVRQGYSKGDIDAALRLVRPHFEATRPAGEAPLGTIRAFSFDEEQRMTREARDALVRLELYGLIAPFERELILERLNHFEGEVGLAELDFLLSWAVCSTRDVESQQTIYNVLEGDGQTFH
jgi:uncharacterized protein Smg (DUF494 family)